MTKSAVAYTGLSDSTQAGAALGAEVSKAFGGKPPHALIVFASSRFDYTQLLTAIKAECHPEIMVGCSSAGEFISKQQGEHSASAIAIRSTEMKFAAGVGRSLRAGFIDSAQGIISSFKGIGREPAMHHTALLLTDALAGHTDELIEWLNMLAGGGYQFFGGGAGDDARFEHTHVFYGTEAFTDAAVALEILSKKPIGIGVQHGWESASEPLHVTEADGMRLVSLNGAPAVEAFRKYARTTVQAFDPDRPLSFFLHNVIGIDSGGGYKLRVPLAVNPDGSIICAADIPARATVRIMRASVRSASEAATAATHSALKQLRGYKPEVALFFDCVATRLRMGDEFKLELSALEKSLGPARYAGCNTYGQVARVLGQFNGFHNCTAVVCVFPGSD